MLQLLATLAFAARIVLPAEDSAQARRVDLMNKLKAGGYTVLLRHARTDYSFKEEIGSIPKERNQQRNLSDDGIRDAALMGVVFRKYGVGFAEIISGPMFRTVETAEMAAGKPTKITAVLRDFPPTPEQEALVKTPPKPGTNRLLVTHHFVIEKHVPGVKPGDVAESEAAVVKHNADGSVQLVGIIKLEDWKALADPGYGQTRPAPAAAKPAAGGTVEYPGTIAGYLGRLYVTAFNTADMNKMKAFMESAFAPDPARTIDERMKVYPKLFEDFGTLSLVSVDSSEMTSVKLSMMSKKGPMVLSLKCADGDPHRLGSVTFTSREHR